MEQQPFTDETQGHVLEAADAVPLDRLVAEQRFVQLRAARPVVVKAPRPVAAVRLEQLLSMLPASSPLGCLAPIAGALFHTSASVRGMAGAILRAIEDHKAARPCVSGLNAFLMQGLALQSQSAGTWA